jgi:hypothetical protein
MIPQQRPNLALPLHIIGHQQFPPVEYGKHL